MEKNYEKDFMIAKVVSAAQAVSVIVIIGITEWMINGNLAEATFPTLPSESSGIIRIVFTFLSALLLLLAFFLKQTIRTMKEGLFMTFLKLQLKMIRSRGNSSATALLITPPALCEMVAVLGFILFILTPGERMTSYPFYLGSLAMMLYIFPTGEEKDNLIALDGKE